MSSQGVYVMFIQGSFATQSSSSLQVYFRKRYLLVIVHALGVSHCTRFYLQTNKYVSYIEPSHKFFIYFFIRRHYSLQRERKKYEYTTKYLHENIMHSDRENKANGRGGFNKLLFFNLIYIIFEENF